MRKYLVQQVFGKSSSDLSAEEQVLLRKARRLASYYRHHALNKRDSRNAAQSDKARLIKDLELEPRCQRCGYDRSIKALDFHHEDQEGKKFPVGLRNKAYSERFEEARKCELVCANCHREHAHRGHGRPLKDLEPQVEMYLALAGFLSVRENGRPRIVKQPPPPPDPTIQD